MLKTIARAGLRGAIFATGMQSIWTSGEHHAPCERAPVRSMMWRVLCSPKADDAGYQRWTDGDDLIWTRGDHIDDFDQEIWRLVFLEQLSFDALLADLAASSPAAKVTAEETEIWIRNWPGSNSKAAWAAYRRHFGNRAGKRDEDFQPAWLRVHGTPARGQPRKSPSARKAA